MKKPIWVKMSTVLLLVGCGSVIEMAEDQPSGQPLNRPLELASPFVDNLVLQREMQVPVWGWATPGCRVTVTFAPRPGSGRAGQSKGATADGKGKWMVKLDPLEASADECELTVTSSRGESITCKGVLVGEVWIASGQSNMAWGAGKSLCNTLRKPIEEAQPPIREFTTDIGSAMFPQSRVTSAEGWKKAGEKSMSFSAIVISFSWSLYQELKVPIGILHSSHGATQIETWTPYEGFEAHPELQEIAARIREGDPTTPEGKAAYEKYYLAMETWQDECLKAFNAGNPFPATPPYPGIGSLWRGPARMYNMKINSFIPYAIRGAIWCQGTSNGGDGKSYTHKMEALVNGWRANWGLGDFPFYFTQQQSWGTPDPDNIGFADLREAQRMFFMNTENVGMVVQYDLGHTKNIHYPNKLDPGRRLARWALAKEYGKKIVYSGPLYRSHSIEGNKVRVRFDHIGGGLMVARKGEEGTAANGEPAREIKGGKLNRFRLAGRDRVWHDADAVIEGDEVVVTCKAVPEPVGVNYAYCANPIDANLYNRAGLPTAPFAYFDDKQVWQEEWVAARAAAGARPEHESIVTLDGYPIVWDPESYPASYSPTLTVCCAYRDHAVVQRNRPLPIWGQAKAGTKVTVTFAGQTKTATAGENLEWRVELGPLEASAEGRAMTVTNGEHTLTIEDILVGDVLLVLGDRNVGLGYQPLDEESKKLPRAVREFRQSTKARTNLFPRRSRWNTSPKANRYAAYWVDVTSGHDIAPRTSRPFTRTSYVLGKALSDRNGVPVGIIQTGADLGLPSFISYEGLQGAPDLEEELKKIQPVYPGTEPFRTVYADHLERVKATVAEMADKLNRGEDAPPALPGLPRPAMEGCPTIVHNRIISPVRPLALSAIVFLTVKGHIGDGKRFGVEMAALARDLRSRYENDDLPFFYTQPTAELVPGITMPKIANSIAVPLGSWLVYRRNVPMSGENARTLAEVGAQAAKVAQ